jgi:hypothetical protein
VHYVVFLVVTSGTIHTDVCGMIIRYAISFKVTLLVARARLSE